MKDKLMNNKAFTLPYGTLHDDVAQILFEIEELFKENKDSFQKIHSEGDLLFTHAGISQNWFDTNFANMDKGASYEKNT